jgi:hypothetical protein
MTKAGFKPALGWTMLSREEMRQVERSLANHEQDTRDEIGFLLIHQGFADRFFPGTSVLHTRIRYALFVPWVYQQASKQRRGSDLETTINRLLIELAIRLKDLGGEPYDVIGGDKLGQLTSQPPDRVYWTALREWGLLGRGVDSRSDALRRSQAAARSPGLDDDGGQLGDDDVEPFAVMQQPAGWDDKNGALHFKLSKSERDFLGMKLGQLTRPEEKALSLLARLVRAGDSFQDNDSWRLPDELDARADDEDKLALRVAGDAAALAAIGRAVYGALVEQLRARDGGPDDNTYRTQLHDHFAEFGEAAARCNLDDVVTFLPELPPYVQTVIQKTREYVERGKPGLFSTLHECYEDAEVKRKKKRARLADTPFAAQRRAEWDPDRHNTTPLHYRWYIVRTMLKDLSGFR